MRSTQLRSLYLRTLFNSIKDRQRIAHTQPSSSDCPELDTISHLPTIREHDVLYTKTPSRNVDTMDTINMIPLWSAFAPCTCQYSPELPLGSRRDTPRAETVPEASPFFFSVCSVLPVDMLHRSQFCCDCTFRNRALPSQNL